MSGGRTVQSVEALAEELGISPVPACWPSHWEEYQRWLEGGACGVEAGDIPDDAREIYCMPDGAMEAIRRMSEHIRSDTALSALAGFWHYLIFHQDAHGGYNGAALPLPVKALGDRAGVFALSVLVSGARHALENHIAAGIPSEIMRETLEIGGLYALSYRERHGDWGHEYLGWTRNHVRAWIFRMGRLVFNAGKFGPGFRVYRNRATGGMTILGEGEAATADRELVLAPGDDVIDVHVPGRLMGGKLLAEDCAASYRRALEFMPAHFPERSFKAFVCWSWLLDPALARILPPDSNIVRFQSAFHLLPARGDASQTLDMAFGSPNVDLSTVTPTTSLQRAIIEFVRAGGQLASAPGFMTMDEACILAHG